MTISKLGNIDFKDFTEKIDTFNFIILCYQNNLAVVIKIHSDSTFCLSEKSCNKNLFVDYRISDYLITGFQLHLGSLNDRIKVAGLVTLSFSPSLLYDNIIVFVLFQFSIFFFS